MIEKWIKIEEIEYSEDTLSEIYGRIDDFDNTQKLEKLVEDNFLIQELKNYSIPYKCKWAEKLVQTNLKFQFKRTKYWIEILIPENYKAQYDKMLKEIKNVEEKNINCEDVEDIEQYNKIYESLNKWTNIIGKVMWTIVLFTVIYVIWQNINQ